MALMEYCLVNIILGDSDAPKPASEPPKPEKVFDLAAKVIKGLLWILKFVQFLWFYNFTYFPRQENARMLMVKNKIMFIIHNIYNNAWLYIFRDNHPGPQDLRP